MENRDLEFLSEIKKAISSLAEQIEELGRKVEEYQHVIDSEAVETEPIDLDIEDGTDDDLPAGEPQEIVADHIETPEAEVSDDLPEEVSAEETAEEETTEVEMPEAEVSDDLPEEVPAEETTEAETLLEDLPEADSTVFDAPEEEPLLQEEPAPAEIREAMIDAMTQKEPWRTDMPGSPVKDIRSAISLNDRILFINTLFAEDPMVFQGAVAAINSMDSLDQVVDYVTENFPQWNMESEIVYRFMMAVRRRVK